MWTTPGTTVSRIPPWRFVLCSSGDIPVICVFTGNDDDIPAAHTIYGRNFARIRSLDQFADTVGTSLFKSDPQPLKKPAFRLIRNAGFFRSCGPHFSLHYTISLQIFRRFSAALRLVSKKLAMINFSQKVKTR